MVNPGSHPEGSSEFDQFNIALKDEYRKKAENIKALAEKEISERLFIVRRDTERKVHSLREKHKKRYAQLLEREKRIVLLKVREEALVKISAILENVSMKVEKEIGKLRSDRTEYTVLLSRLVMEALDALGERAVIKVHPADASILPSDPRIVSFVEVSSGFEGGGCIAEDADTGTRVIDNRIISRWKQFQKVSILGITENFGDVLQKFDRFSRELRIS